LHTTSVELVVLDAAINPWHGFQRVQMKLLYAAGVGRNYLLNLC